MTIRATEQKNDQRSAKNCDLTRWLLFYTLAVRVSQDQCYARTNVFCPYGEFVCSNGDCIPWYFRCDGKHDCPNGNDEAYCESKRGFHCPDGRTYCGLFMLGCIPRLWRCDGKDDCTFGMDEKDCAPVLTVNSAVRAKGDKVTFTCAPRLYQLYASDVEGYGLERNKKIVLFSSTEEITINNLDPSNSGSYTCTVIVDGLGSITSDEVVLTVLDCQNGKFGHKCDHNCHCLRDSEVCNKESGHCSSGCAPGWTGDSCQSKAITFPYGTGNKSFFK